ncbi:uncharacterized protein [Drosophila kikkawai]|uniref:CCHC-type domain-containing protein n=1 Tax=Drosophila kikkawai TaxID=30033 RepID=A0ABM3C4P1_DROKI
MQYEGSLQTYLSRHGSYGPRWALLCPKVVARRTTARAPAAYLAGALLTATSDDPNDLGAFQKRSKLQRTPPSGGPTATGQDPERVLVPIGRETSSSTPPSKRVRDSPSPPVAAHPRKKIKAPKPQIKEMGLILDDLLAKVNEQKVRSINQSMKNAFARLKELQEELSLLEGKDRADAIAVADQWSQTDSPMTRAWPSAEKSAQTSPKSRPRPASRNPGTTPVGRASTRPPPRAPTHNAGRAQKRVDSDSRLKAQSATMRREGSKRGKNDAIIITPAAEMSYSEVLSMVTRTKDSRMAGVGDMVSRVRKTAKGELLIELKKSSGPSLIALKEQIGGVLGGGVPIRTVSPQTTFLIRDLDELVTREELAAELASQANCPPGAVTIKSIRSLASGGQVAMFSVPETMAGSIDSLGRVKVGWTRCRIKMIESRPRCFRCMETGHIAARCTSTSDRSSSCFRCGQEGHKIAACKNSPRCFSCAESNRSDTNHQAAHDLLSQSIRERGVDVAAISEPYRVGPGPYWAVDSSGKAALWSCGITPKRMADVRSERGFVRAKMAGWWMFSVYLAPSMSFEDFGDAVDRLAADARCHTPCLIAGDFNAWAVDWGSSLTNARGRTLLEAFSTLDVTLLNTGGRPHVSRRGYKADTLDIQAFAEHLQRLEVNGSAEQMAESAMIQLQTACDDCMSAKRAHTRHRDSVYWWNETIAAARSECIKARRRYQRSYRSSSHLKRRSEFRRCRKALKAAIRASKTQCFLDLCDTADHDPWGNAYRIIVKKIHGAKQGAPHDAESIDRIVEHLFPRTDNPRDTLEIATHSLEGFEPVTDTEILAVAMRIREAKAPGPDLVPNRALRLALSLRPDLFAELYGRCLREGKFPGRWKVQRLVLLPKPGKPPEDPSAYKPICLIDGAGKVLEQLIRTRLEKAIATAGYLSDSQFGFRKAKSTVDAISKVVGIAKAATIAGQRWKGGAKEYA